MKNSPNEYGSLDFNKPEQAGSSASVVDALRSQEAEAEYLVRSAMDYVNELIRVNEGRWIFYRNINASLLEQWLKDDHPNLHRCVIRIGAYDVFKQQLLEYCGRFSAARALAQRYLISYFWSLQTSLVMPFRLEEGGDREEIYELSDVDTESYFPGVASDIDSGRLTHTEDLPTMVALLVDRFLRLRHSNRHNNARIALHTRLTEQCGRWSDWGKVNDAPLGTAFLVKRRAFSEELYSLTSERYVLVMRMPEDTTLDFLIQGARVARLVDTSCEQPEHYLALSEGRIAIPVLRNDELLLKFRNFIPIVFLVGEKMWLVEYEWNPTAYGNDFIDDVRSGTIQTSDTNAVEGDEAMVEEANARGTGDAVVIAEIRAMPVIPETPFYLLPDYVERVWNDSIPF
ncbi:hypothetical protein [Paraburkholderia azotifigens]|uniref:Uncharacterized protein n=1 Tax=Paraburkholderia azotifigens TaxID=2057004 RepID=A0A5C6V6E1_9BURK|nr:hypothetical protein [Paraburkholderia azotifigens]TXC80599.1 hypothetical protein FRZ40_40800 [Paraburkholderia azotifigens]